MPKPKLPSLAQVRRFALEAKKALTVLGSFVGLAVTLGVIDNARAASITAGLGVATTVAVWVVKNLPPKGGES